MATTTHPIPTIPTDKSARLSCRIRPRVKERAEEAARLLGLSITEFAESALEEKAGAVLAENERIVLSERDFDAFVAAITGEPEPPSPALLDAVAAYRKHEPLRFRTENPGSEG